MNTTLTTISVVIPVYNGQRTILETVNSVLGQTFRDFELIVIDDGSQDATAEILAAIDDSRLKVFSFPNAGVAASRNRGFELASGEFISFLDADDLWTPDKLEAQLDALRDHPDAAVAYSWTDFIREDGTWLGYGINRFKNGYVFPDLLVSFFIASGSNALIRRGVLDQVGGFDASVIPAEDWDLFLRLAARFSFVAVPKAQIKYRVVKNSLSSNVLRQEKSMLKVIERAYSQEPGISLQHLKKYSYANMYLYLTGRALNAIHSRQNGLHAARFLWRSFVNDPGILKQYYYISILLIKMAMAILLTHNQAQTLRATVKSLSQRTTADANDIGGN